MSAIAITNPVGKYLLALCIVLLGVGGYLIVVGMSAGTPKAVNHAAATATGTSTATAIPAATFIAPTATTSNNTTIAKESHDDSPPVTHQEKETVVTVDAPQIITRDMWGAEAPVKAMKRQTVSRITIHHTGTAQKRSLTIEKKMRYLQEFSQHESRMDSGKMKPVWADIPYHYYISVDGRIAEGRNIDFAGDTNTEYDPSGHALVVVEGNFETEEPTAEQIKSLQAMVSWLRQKYSVTPDAIKGHCDYAATDCPGKNLYSMLPNFRR